MKKRLFQILDEINVDDAKNSTRNIAVSNGFVRMDKTKEGCQVTMASDSRAMADLLTNEAIPVLLIINKEEYNKLK